MKIALPSRNNSIDDHFGHCEYYTIFTINNETKEIISSEILQSPKGCGCKSNISTTLSDIGVEVLLAGNMGEGALKTLNNAGIEVLRGCSGNVQDVAQKWLHGSLIDSSELCHNHDCQS